MNFNFLPLKFLRILLFPFSLLYGCIIVIRNYLFDKNILKSATFNLPIIAIGNLSTGGTGKTPMVEYLVELLKSEYKTSIISRGYKRKTKGYILANAQATAFEIGDEPMQFHIKFPDVPIAVGEERILAIPHLLQDKPDTEVIILDDAFQHRRVKAGFNILLTEYKNLFTKDFFLPTGNLRDQRSSYKRADVVLVTKCPFSLTENEKRKIKKQIRPFSGQNVFFTATEYGSPYHIATQEQREIAAADDVLVVSGIANPAPLKDFADLHAKHCHLLSFSDHHVYTKVDIKQILKKFESIYSDKKIIITTEKDAVRLATFHEALYQLPVFVLPVKHVFLFGEGMQFDYLVKTFINNFSVR